MIAITVGVPVYNGADLLDESLACLARQTFQDFKVIVVDNASTDGSADIARAWAERDPRFQYVRQDQQVTLMNNFLAALRLADTSWFLWRADDDLSADNYLETLYRLAVASPGCKLAVSTVVTSSLTSSRRMTATPSNVTSTPSLWGRLLMLRRSHPSWFYGLWDRETILSIYPNVCENYPFPFAADHLALYGPIIQGSVRSTDATVFYQRLRKWATKPRRRPRDVPRMASHVIEETRRAFRGELSRIRKTSQISATCRVALIAWEPIYLHGRVPGALRLMRNRLREKFGLTKSYDTARYFERQH
jgi:glycosyltransferase involved in cell wall biosynthesis